MSDYIVKIVPQNPLCKISEFALAKAKDFLESRLLCDSIQIEKYDTPAFVDCGSNLESIECPECGADLDLGWWSEAMDAAHEKNFVSPEMELPCCGRTASLNNLKYHPPCAFACCVIEILNPKHDIEKGISDYIQKLLCTEIHIIKAHI